MLTEEKILEFAKNYLEVLVTDDDEMKLPTDFAATKEQLIDFVKEVYAEGYDYGWDDCQAHYNF